MAEAMYSNLDARLMAGRMRAERRQAQMADLEDFPEEEREELPNLYDNVSTKLRAVRQAARMKLKQQAGEKIKREILGAASKLIKRNLWRYLAGFIIASGPAIFAGLLFIIFLFLSVSFYEMGWQDKVKLLGSIANLGGWAAIKGMVSLFSSIK